MTSHVPHPDDPCDEPPFSKLPERVPPEQMTTAEAAMPVPDPTGGRDPDTDFLLRNAG